MDNIKQAISISSSLLPKTKESRKTRNKFFHFAFGFRKNKLLAIGQNNPEKTHTSAYRIAKKFRVDTTYPYPHAEIDLLARLWNKSYITNDLSIVVLRLNKCGQLRNSKPCQQCRKILSALDITKVYWSTENGFKQS